MENAKIADQPTFPPKNLWNKWEIRASQAALTNLDTLKNCESKGPVEKFEAHHEFGRGENHAKKRRRRTKLCSHWRPIRGQIRIKYTTINQTNIFMHISGVHLCISGWIGRLWLSWCHFSSAALFRVLKHRLIVLNYIFSYNKTIFCPKLCSERNRPFFRAIAPASPGRTAQRKFKSKKHDDCQQQAPLECIHDILRRRESAQRAARRHRRIPVQNIPPLFCHCKSSLN